jgi:UDP-glucose 6-dehydrogenase
MKYGFGYGGPCLPRDNKAFAKCAEKNGITAHIPIATDKVNEEHLETQVSKFISDNRDKSIPVKFDYLTYKKDSTSYEESQLLKFAIKLQEAGYTICVNDLRESTQKELHRFR